MNRSFVVETLESRMLFAGVTILATGRLGGTNGWIQSMANEITAKEGGASQVPEYRLTINADPTTENLVPTMQHVDGTATPQSGSSGEIILIIDYSSVSANPIYPSTYIGQVIANYMMNTPVDGIQLASLPIHSIGVSRGSAIIDGISQTLGQSGVWVDQETYLDPNPLAAQGDPPSTIYDNVAFVDNYWRNDGSASQINDGHPVDGAYNLHLSWLDTSAPDGYSVVHLAPSGYYEGTIDLTATSGGEGPIPSSWYGTTPDMPARDQTGFLYSAMMGGARPLSGVWAASGGTGTRTAAGQSGIQWGNATGLNVTTGNTVASGNSINVSYLHQDRDSADTITFFLDTDRNPYNNAFAATLGTANFGLTSAITQSFSTLSTTGVAPGSYWLGAKITDTQGNTRYTYESVNSQLKVTAPVGTPPPVQTPPPVGNQLGTVTGRFFNDLNGNGVADAGEPGLSGFLVFVDLAGTGRYQSGDPSATTGANGDYSISGLTPGIPLTIHEVVPGGMRETTAPSAVTLTSGQTLAVADFGATQTAKISGVVSLKSIPNTPAVSNPSGFQVTLTQHPKRGKAQTFVTFTKADGTFAFNGLLPGAGDTIKLVKRKGFKLAPHSRASYTLKVNNGQVVSNLIFSQVPVVVPARRAKVTK